MASFLRVQMDHISIATVPQDSIGFPLRAKLAADLKGLDRYSDTGHSVLKGESRMRPVQ